MAAKKKTSGRRSRVKDLAPRELAADETNRVKGGLLPTTLSGDEPSGPTSDPLAGVTTAIGGAVKGIAKGVGRIL